MAGEWRLWGVRRAVCHKPRSRPPFVFPHPHVFYPVPRASLPHTAVHPSQAVACGGEVQLGEHAAEAVALAARAAGRGGGGDISLGVRAPAPAFPPGSGGGGGALPPPRCNTLFAWQHAVSPHLAVQLEGGSWGRMGAHGGDRATAKRWSDSQWYRMCWFGMSGRHSRALDELD